MILSIRDGILAFPRAPCAIGHVRHPPGRLAAWPLRLVETQAASGRGGTTATLAELRIAMRHWKYLRRSNSLIVLYMFAR